MNQTDDLYLVPMRLTSTITGMEDSTVDSMTASEPEVSTYRL